MSLLDAFAVPMMIASTALSAAGVAKSSKAAKASGAAAAEATILESRIAAQSYLDQGVAMREAGEVERQAAAFEARQLKTQAGQERAAAQRRAEEEQRQARIAESRAIALAAASGAGGASDPGVARLLSQLGEEGEYRSLLALFEGESLARGLELDAKVRKWEGEQAARVGRIAMASAERRADMTLSAAERIAGLQRGAGKTAATTTLLSGIGSIAGGIASRYI